MRRLFVIAVLLVSLLAACSAGLPQGVVYPSITLDQKVTEDIPVSRTFTFEGQPVTISTTVDGSLYAGAKQAEKAVTRFGNARENDWIEDYFPAFVEEQHQQQFYEDLLAALRAVRDQRALDSDRYAELLTVFVQSLEYKTDPEQLEPKFPVETFVDGNGDCDDKTLLLAGLLTREGYDVAILLFETERHVALGIRSAEAGYLDTGYAYTETTASGLIGMVPDTFASGMKLSTRPRVFAIGAGKTTYTAGDEVRAILDGRRRAVEQAVSIEAEISDADAKLVELKETIRTKQAQLQQMKAAGRVSEYNAQVAEYNTLVDRHNALVRERNGLAERHNELASLEKIILEGLADRPATYAAVTAVLE